VTARFAVIVFNILVAWQLRRAWTKAELAKANSDAVVKSRDQFMAIAAHELRSPIAAMKLQIEMATKRCADKDTIERLGTLKRHVGRMEDLVGNLLDAAKMCNGRLEFKRENIDLGVVVHEIITRHEEVFIRAGCEPVLEIRPGVNGTWDRMRIEQIVINLVSNACKYGDKKPIHIRVWNEGPDAFLEVEDNGIGIHPDYQKRIFQQYQRAVSEKDFAGLGLGLWITSQIVVAKGGEIKLKSCPGSGSTFTVRLPRKKTSESWQTSKTPLTLTEQSQ